MRPRERNKNVKLSGGHEKQKNNEILRRPRKKNKATKKNGMFRRPWKKKKKRETCSKATGEKI